MGAHGRPAHVRLRVRRWGAWYGETPHVKGSGDTPAVGAWAGRTAPTGPRWRFKLRRGAASGREALLRGLALTLAGLRLLEALPALAEVLRLGRGGGVVRPFCA